MKVGDIVTCKKEYDEYYRFTKTGIIGKVQEILDGEYFTGIFFLPQMLEDRKYDVEKIKFERVFAKVG